MTCCRWFVVLALLATSSTVWAQEPAPRIVTLAEVLRRAEENPPAVLAAYAALERLTAQQAVASGAYLPTLTVSATGGYGYQNAPVLPPPDALRLDSSALVVGGNVALDYAVLDAARAHRVRAAKAGTRAQEQALSAARRVAGQAALELFFRARAATKLLDDARLTLERRNTQLASVSALIEAGVRPQIDEQRASIDAIAARHAVDVRAVEEQAAMAALAAAVGEDPTQLLAPDPSEADRLGDPAQPAVAVAQAIERRPELKQLEALLEARVAEHAAAKGLRLPTAGVSASADLSYREILEGLGLDGHVYGATGLVFVRWSALDASVWRQARVADAAVREAEKQLAAGVLAVRAEVVDAALLAQRARAQLEQATQVLAAAQITRTSQNERYRAGVASLLELLDAEAVEQSARRTIIEAQREYDVARARLVAVSGGFSNLR